MQAAGRDANVALPVKNKACLSRRVERHGMCLAGSKLCDDDPFHAVDFGDENRDFVADRGRSRRALHIDAEAVVVHGNMIDVLRKIGINRDVGVRHGKAVRSLQAVAVLFINRVSVRADPDACEGIALIRFRGKIDRFAGKNEALIRSHNAALGIHDKNVVRDIVDGGNGGVF